MLNYKTPRLFLLAALVGVPASLLAQGDPAVIARIIDEGKHRNQVMKHLREICDIGPRLTGSPKLQKSLDWAVAKFKSFGISNARLEKWGDIPVGFQRGTNSSGRMVAPFDVPIVFTTPSWTEGTNGPLRGHAVIEPTTQEEFERVKPKLKGAWVIGAFSMGRGAAPTDLQKAVMASGINGRVTSARGELVITSGTFRDKTFENRSKDRTVIVRKSDMERIQRNLEFGREVILEFNLDQKWVKGPVPIYNVIADIPGTEKPDEMVIVSGHIDSWDGPSSQGAVDNGTGTCTAIEAARILMKVGAKPKRTIRFILWTGEEQGLLGSRAYVEAHKAEMDKIQVVLVDDGGTNYHGGYVGPESLKEAMTTAMTPTMEAFPDLPMVYRVVASIRNQGGGSDHAPFWAYGVPSFFTIEAGRSDYTYAHHTQHDRFEYAIPEYLVQSATNHAVVAFNLACRGELLPRQPIPAPGQGGRGGGGGGGQGGGG